MLDNREYEAAVAKALKLGLTVDRKRCKTQSELDDQTKRLKSRIASQQMRYEMGGYRMRDDGTYFRPGN